ncbi:MAG: hypothetical protein N2748_03385, partial [candidate division WOR-3 bacterium]|nr:hypothetical protein [candidate division WOR-3 bacterium]
MSSKKLLLTLILLGLIGFAFAKTEAKSEFVLSDLPLLKANEIDPYAELPAPVFDTTRIWTGSTANLIREIKGGKYFKGAADDTFRLVTVQSGGTRMLVIATDTMTDAWKRFGYRIETPLTYGSGWTAEPVAIGNVDGDEYTDILYATTATVFRLYWVEWDVPTGSWRYRDSITVNAAINDITFGDGDNNPATRDFYFNIAQTSPVAAIMRASWTGTSWDTTRILCPTGFTTATRAVAIGDVDPTFPGNEVYFAQGTNIFQALYSSATGTWTTIGLIGMGYTISDMDIGGSHPLLTGPVIACVFASTAAQVGIAGWTGTTWGGWLWALTSTWSTTVASHDIAFGDVYLSNPGTELVVSCGAVAAGRPAVFWVAPNGTAWVWWLAEPIASGTEYGVAVSPLINRFKAFTDEFVIVGGNAVVEYEERDFVNDVGTYYFQTFLPTAIQNAWDTIYVTIFNDGSAPQTGFSVGYLCRF